MLQDSGGITVWLRSAAGDEERLCDATHVVIRGEGYDSLEEGTLEGERWRDVISRAFARVHLAADFGDRKPFGSLTAAGETALSEQQGHPVLGARPGLTVFVDQPGLRFVDVSAELCRRPAEDENRRVLSAAARLIDPMRNPERLAFDLYSGSFFQPSSDARLLMLTMAVETLLDPSPRSDTARAHVARLVEATNENGALTEPERQSLAGSLTWLVSESIGQAGRHLVKKLEPRTYAGKSPGAFFTACYNMRSALTHGHLPRPSREGVDVLAADLERWLVISSLVACSKSSRTDSALLSPSCQGVPREGVPVVETPCSSNRPRRPCRPTAPCWSAVYH